MFHKALDLKYLEGTSLCITFSDGKVIKYDISSLFNKYPIFKALNNRELFLSGKLQGFYGIIWTEDLDLEVETVYSDGTPIMQKNIKLYTSSASAVAEARAKSGISQSELSKKTGINQSDISRIEKGIANPSVKTLERIAEALNGKLIIKIIDI